MKKQPKSKKPGKQKKWRACAPPNRRQKMVGASLSRELREKYGRRSLPIRKGDKVKVVKGDFSGFSGEVTKVMHTTYKINVGGINIKKADGTDVPKSLDPSNVTITELYLEDRERRGLLERKAR
ncbi:MAG: 50S ribosomal protein L24 [Candidatus Altiarchaeota archaeon]|nr:50S ribosomal protein L24 [Candidatus Altiarchaeota archaeon]